MQQFGDPWTMSRLKPLIASTCGASNSVKHV